MHGGDSEHAGYPACENARMQETSPRLAVIGGGPAGLMAAETARAAGVSVAVYEAKGSVGRKFLIAGKGGLNLTHSDQFPTFLARYGERAPQIEPLLRAFDAEALRAWARGLGVETFIGSSGRVFPLDLKAAPLLRGWVRRLREQGVEFHVQHRCLGWNDDGSLRFATAEGERSVQADAVVLALGGGSWPQLGSDATWVPWLRAAGVAVNELRPANCGFDVAWSRHFAERFAGHPLKPLRIFWHDAQGRERSLQGECVVSADGIEGSLIYALSAQLRETIAQRGEALVHLDLAPGRERTRLLADLAQARNGRSLSEHLRRRAGIDGVKAGLVFEFLEKTERDNPEHLAERIKRLPLRLLRPRPLAEAISTAGGIRFDALSTDLMLAHRPGVFAAGEMLDWEAPTGGYLLTACFASGRHAGEAAAKWLRRHRD